MKTVQPKNSQLIADNLTHAAAQVNATDRLADSDSLYLATADFLDCIVRGEVTHFTLGMNRARTSLLLTVNHSNGSQSYVAFEDITSMVWNVAEQVADVAALAVLQ